MAKKFPPLVGDFWLFLIDKYVWGGAQDCDGGDDGEGRENDETEPVKRMINNHNFTQRLLSNSNNLSLKIVLRLPPLHLSGFGSCYSAKVKFFQIVLENTCFAHTNRKF